MSGEASPENSSLSCERISRRGWCLTVSTEQVSNKEVVMHRVGCIGMIGLGIALAGYLGGAPVFVVEQPPRAAAVDGSKITITSPKDGDKVTDSFELKYELIKGSQVTHVHVYVDDE